MRWYLPLLIALMLTVASPSWPQATRGFNTGKAGTCPGTDEVEQLVGRRGATGVGAGWTYVVASSPRTFQNNLPASDTSDVKPPLFRPVAVYAYERDRKRVLVRWKADNRELCTWIVASDVLLPATGRNREVDPMADLLEGPRPLRVRDIDPQDPDNSLTVKAVLSNLNVQGDKGIQTYTTPEGDQTFLALTLFEQFTVYAKRAGKPRGPNNENLYLLLGKASSAGQQQLFGWVHIDDVYLWNSRMAAYWKGSKKGRGWVLDTMTGRSIVDEPPGEEPRSHGIARFPILQVTPDSYAVQKAAARLTTNQRTSLALSSLVEKYQVVIPGIACREGKQDCISADQLEERQRLYQEKVEGLRKIDVLFLIDGTESMDEYFGATAKAIQQFIQDRFAELSQKGVSLRVSVATYGDYDGPAADVSRVYYEELVPFYDPGTRDARPLNRLVNYKVARDRDKHLDKLEAPFAGIIRAVGNAKWRDDAGFHFLVHLADHGNRDVGKTSPEGKSQLVEKVSIDETVEALKRKRVIYIPISVLGNPTESTQFERDARDQFLRQAARIIELRGLADSGKAVVQKSYDKVGQPETALQRQGAVVNALRGATESFIAADQIVALRELCARSSGGDACSELRQVEGRSDDYLSRIATVGLVESGLTKEQTENVLSRSQSVLYAWVRPVERDGSREVETLSYWVAMDGDRLRNLREAFAQLCEIVKPNAGNTTIRIKQGILEAVQAGSGQDVQPSQTLATALSLPFWERTDMLSLSIETISQWVQQNEIQRMLSLRRAFCRSSYLLKLVDGQRQVDSSSVKSDDQGRVVEPDRASLKLYDWQVKSDRGEPMYYVPIEYFP